MICSNRFDERSDIDVGVAHMAPADFFDFMGALPAG
jgi:hypothetical protein